MYFHENLKRVINARGLKISDIHKATGIPKSTLSEWSAGRVPKLSEQVLGLAHYLEVTLEYLVTGKENSRSQAPVEAARLDVMIEGEHYQLKLLKVVNTSRSLRQS